MHNVQHKDTGREDTTDEDINKLVLFSWDGLTYKVS